MAKRIVPDRCCGVIVDVQGFFLSQLDQKTRLAVEDNTAHLVRLLGYFKIPIVATLERPVLAKGDLPDAVGEYLAGLPRQLSGSFEKDFYDLTKEPKIRTHLAKLKRKQMIVTGCETDVCVLQSCLGLLELGYEVFVVEDLLFSSAGNVASAKARMQAEGAVLLTYKTLYFELIEAVGESRHMDGLVKRLGPFPDDLPESAV